jgi:hypothetical protein
MWRTVVYERTNDATRFIYDYEFAINVVEEDLDGR